jgi:hypothetical protein
MINKQQQQEEDGDENVGDVHHDDNNDADDYTLRRLNRSLGTIRKVRSSLWKQPNIRHLRDTIRSEAATDYRNLPPRPRSKSKDRG